MSSSRRRGSIGLETLGALLRRDGDIRLPATVDASPVAPRDWEAAVGTRIAARARPFKLERGVLWVRTATATWAQELTLLADAILAQLAARGVRVKSLRFHVGRVDPPERPPSRSEVRTSPKPAPIPDTVATELARVGDDELRRAIAEAAAKNLGWQAAREREEKAVRASRGRRAPAGRSESAEAVARGGAARTDDAPARRPAPAGPDASTSARSNARAPRSAAGESARQDRSSPTARGDRRGKP